VLRAVADAHCVDYHMAGKSLAGGRWMGLTDTFCHHPLVHARGTIVIVIIIEMAHAIILRNSSMGNDADLEA
jgi:hypothetical protein